VINLAVEDKYLIEKRNILNEVRSNGMSLQEQRFFAIYLAKINARDISTRVVRFSLEEYQKIMDLGKLNLAHLHNSVDGLLGKVIGVTLENGDHARFQLFKKTIFSQDKNGGWHIEIDAHDDALPLMFEFKERYFTYELWNALRLKSSNQLRMYEILKQYESLGERTISIDDLKELLGMKKSEYPRYNSFRADVLDVCKQALEACTDIKFAYGPSQKKGRGGKVTALKFTISKNDNYTDPLALADFIDLPNSRNSDTDNVAEVAETEFQSECLGLLAGACDNEFNEAEIQVLYNLVAAILPRRVGESIGDFNLKAYGYLKHRYDELNMRAGRGEIKKRFGYLKKMLDGAVKEVQEEQ